MTTARAMGSTRTASMALNPKPQNICEQAWSLPKHVMGPGAVVRLCPFWLSFFLFFLERDMPSQTGQLGIWRAGTLKPVQPSNVHLYQWGSGPPPRPLVGWAMSSGSVLTHQMAPGVRVGPDADAANSWRRAWESASWGLKPRNPLKPQTLNPTNPKP